MKYSQLTRRIFLAGGAAGVSLLRGASARIQEPACTLVSEQEDGPYYVDGAMLRRAISEHKTGLPLRLRVSLVNARTCAPLSGAALDVWHCDALGVYSGYTQNGSGSFGPPPGSRGGGPPPGPPPDDEFDLMGMPPSGGPHRPLDKTRFCRGVQITGRGGVAEFDTIYAGWYVSRDIHIHLKVHVNKHVCHTGQLFFPDDMSDAVARLAPYRTHHADRTRLQEDHVFQDEHGSTGMVTLERMSRKSLEGGLLARVVLAVDPLATPKLSFPGPPSEPEGPW